jgi:heat shock protein HslJ
MKSALLALLLTMNAPAQPAFEAFGHDPSWRASIGIKRLEFEAAQGPRFVLDTGFDAGLRQPVQLGLQWQGQPVLLRAEPQLCHDSRSGSPYPWRVSFTVGGQVFLGCGGEPAQLLQGTAWVLDTLADRPAPGAGRAKLLFEPGGALSGHLVCNRLQGRYSADAQGLALTARAATRRACVPESDFMAERELLTLLPTLLRFDLDDQGRLLLRALDGRVLRLTKAPASP